MGCMEAPMIPEYRIRCAVARSMKKLIRTGKSDGGRVKRGVGT